jgi:hypothetical protein
MAAIAMRESHGNPAANNAGLNSNGTVDHGLWQVNDIWANDPGIRAIGWGNRYNARANAEMMKVILGKQGLQAWALNGAIPGEATIAQYGGGAQGDGIGHARGRSGRPGRRIDSGPVRRPAPVVRARGTRGGGGGVSITFSGPIYVRNRGDVDAVAEKVGQKILRALGGAGGDSAPIGGEESFDG